MTDAMAQRSELIAERNDNILGMRGLTGSRRERAIRKQTLIDAKLSFLNDWMQRHKDDAFQEACKWGADTDQVGKVNEFKKAADGILEYVAFLVRELAAARAEINRLKKELEAAKDTPIQF